MYIVTKQYGRGSEARCGEFKDKNAANAFVQEKLAEDASMKIKVIYRIYEWDEVIQTFDPDKLVTPAPQSTSDTTASSQGKSSSASFRPTPFNPAPRPSGIPHNWVKDDEKDKGKE